MNTILLKTTALWDSLNCIYAQHTKTAVLIHHKTSITTGLLLQTQHLLDTYVYAQHTKTAVLIHHETSITTGLLLQTQHLLDTYVKANYTRNKSITCKNSARTNMNVWTVNEQWVHSVLSHILTSTQMDKCFHPRTTWDILTIFNGPHSTETKYVK